MEINGDEPPLIWPQFETTGYNRRRSSIPTIFGPTMIAAISAVILLLIVIFVVPPFLSITSQILQPSSVKKGWDSINVVLVVFAILCGVLARRNDDGSSSSSPSHGEEEEEEEEEIAVTSGEDTKISSSSSVSEQWFDDVYDVDRLKIYESVSSSRSFSPGLPVTGSLPLRRSSSSYPDLRHGVSRETVDRRFRFYDDFEIDKYRSQSTVLIDDSRSLYQQFPSRTKIEIEESETKEIPVDKFVIMPPSPPHQEPPAPPPPPPPPAVEVLHKPRRSHRSVRNRDIIQENSKRSDTKSDSTKFKRAFHPPPSPPPPPPPLITATPPRKQGTLQRRKSNAAKEIKMVFASLYNQGKNKKKIPKSKRKDRTESPVVVTTVSEPPQYQSSFPPPSPPPPPPPPPPPLRSSQSVFYGLFKKGVKSKKIHSVPPPPPPPPPRSKFQSGTETPPRRLKSGRPPRPMKQINLNEENYQGSPLVQITPPPPPPPPFRVPPLKFVVSGDFAKIRSNQSSRCSSPEREVIDIGWGLELTQSDGGVETSVAVGSGGGRPGFCPSPDVNTKADNFIARLRDEWRLDKINSVQGKRNMGSL